MKLDNFCFYKLQIYKDCTSKPDNIIKTFLLFYYLTYCFIS